MVGLLLIASPGTLGATEPPDPSATFYLSPSMSSVVSGAGLSIELRLKVVNDSTHSARARLTYPADKMELANVTPASPFFEADKKYESGVINVAYGSISGVSGDQLFTTLNFKVNASSGEASIVIDPIIDANYRSYVAGDAGGTGANILKSVSNGTYSITKTGSSSPAGSVSSQPNQKQTKQPANVAQDETKPTSLDSNIGAPDTNSLKTVESGAGLVNKNGAPAPATVIDKAVIILALPALVLAAFAARAINRRYRGRGFIARIRRRQMASSRHETIANIAVRVNLARPDTVSETVAEIAARVNRSRLDTKNETVAELAARLRVKAKSKRPGHHLKARHQTRKDAKL